MGKGGDHKSAFSYLSPSNFLILLEAKQGIGFRKKKIAFGPTKKKDVPRYRMLSSRGGFCDDTGPFTKKKTSNEKVLPRGRTGQISRGRKHLKRDLQSDGEKKKM